MTDGKRPLVRMENQNRREGIKLSTWKDGITGDNDGGWVNQRWFTKFKETKEIQGYSKLGLILKGDIDPLLKSGTNHAFYSILPDEVNSLHTLDA